MTPVLTTHMTLTRSVLSKDRCSSPLIHLSVLLLQNQFSSSPGLSPSRVCSAAFAHLQLLGRELLRAIQTTAINAVFRRCFLSYSWLELTMPVKTRC